MPWNTTSSILGAAVGRQMKTSTAPPPRSTECSPSPGIRIAVMSKPYVHRQAVAIPLVRGTQPCRFAGCDQHRRPADGDRIEDIVARRARQAFHLGLEAVPRKQAAALGEAFGQTFLAQHRLAAIHACEGELGMSLVDDPLETGACPQEFV